MAFKDKSESNFFKLNELEVGGTYECYPVKTFEVTFKDGRKGTNVTVVNADTDEVQTIGTPGNLKYAFADGKIELGQLTRFTRLEDRKYGAIKGSAFTIEQDDEDVLSDDRLSKVGAEAAVLPATNNKQLAAEKVKREAEALAAQATKRS